MFLLVNLFCLMQNALLLAFTKIKINKINALQPSATCHIKTSHLFCRAEQLTGFYMECNTGLKWVNRNSTDWENFEIKILLTTNSQGPFLLAQNMRWRFYPLPNKFLADAVEALRINQQPFYNHIVIVHGMLYRFLGEVSSNQLKLISYGKNF